VQHIVLEMPRHFAFRAGQYLEVVHREGTIPLSIASGPRRLPELHLHYRSTPGVREAAWMDELLEHGGPLTVRGPAGDVMLPETDDLPLLLVAGGTGISQVCALIDQLVIEPVRAPVTTLWCVDAAEDLYCRAELDAIRRPWLELECIVDARRGPDNAGIRRLAGIGRRLAAGPATAAPWILLAGSPGFVYAASDALTGAGVDAARLHADAFAWAPRPA
jgi:CDP-4-dehydro-6-deoxyglucose reductase